MIDAIQDKAGDWFWVVLAALVCLAIVAGHALLPRLLGYRQPWERGRTQPRVRR